MYWNQRYPYFDLKERAMNSKPPCKFYPLGTCRKGANCPFPHINPNRNSYNASGGQSFGQVNTKKRLEEFWDTKSLDRRSQEISSTLNEVGEHQSLSLSSYGLPDPATENLISGRDYSFEESRLDFYQAQQSNAIPEYEKMISIRQQDMKNCIDFLKKDTRKAARYSQVTAKQRFENPSSGSPKPFIDFPLDLTGNSMSNTTQSPFGSTPFGSSSNSSSNPFNSQTTANPFGGASLTSNTSPFGNQNSKPSIFGAPSLSQNSSSSPFGQSSLGGGTSGAFGTQSLGSSSAFGNSGIGSTGSNKSPFGGASLGATSTTNSLAAPKQSAFGSSGFGSSGFGSTANNNNLNNGGSSFGGSAFNAKPTGSSAFGSSGFGSNSLGSGTGGAFGSASLGNKPATSSAFGSAGLNQQASQTLPFGQTKPASESAFGTSGFGTSTSSVSPFGAAATGANSNPSPFGTTSTHSPFGASSTTEKSSVFGQPSSTQSTSPFGQTSQKHQQQPFTNSAFGQNSSSSSSLGQTTSGGSAFGQASDAKPSPFGQSQSIGEGLGSVQFGVFGGNSAGSGQKFNPMFKQAIKEEPRVNEDELGAEVKAQFAASEFTIGLVPEIPPPLAYC